LGFNGTFSTHRLYRALKSMLQLKKELNKKDENVTCLEYIK